jgi:AcrR family transcriptional regulator
MRMQKSPGELGRNGAGNVSARRMSSTGIARRRLLMSKARKLLSKKLLNDISMNDVAEAAKIPKGSAYFFYDSMDSLWSALAGQMYIELGDAMLRPLEGELNNWGDVFAAVLDYALVFIESDLAVSQLLVGPHIPAALKSSMRASDVGLGRIVDQILSSRFVLPEMPDRPKMFFLALEICDVFCTVSMTEHGRLTPEYKAECVRASLAYLRTYLPHDLPRAKPGAIPRR